MRKKSAVVVSAVGSLSVRSIDLNSAACKGDKPRLVTDQHVIMAEGQIRVSECLTRQGGISFDGIDSPGPHGVPVHSSVSLIALDGCKIFFVGPFIDV